MKKKFTKALALGLSLATALTLPLAVARRKTPETTRLPQPKAAMRMLRKHLLPQVNLATRTALGYLAAGFQTQRHWNYLRVPVCTD